jgi:TolA-binding protein
MTHAMRRSVAVALAAAMLSAAAAVAADPEEAQYNVVVTLYNAGQWEAALKKIQEREAQDLAEPMRTRYLYARGLALEKGGKSGDAAKAYTTLIDKFPNAAEAMKARLAVVFIRYTARDYDAVLAAIQQIRPDGLSGPERQQLAVMTGEAWAAKSDQKKAVEAYDQALKLGADRTSLQPKLFNAYYQLRMHKELIELSKGGIPGIEADALAAIRAEALLELGQFSQAEAEARKVPAGSANLPRASFTLAQALIKQGKLADAVAPLQAAIQGLQKPPVPPSARLALAECLLAAGQPAEADAAVRQALEHGRSLPDAEAKAFRSQAALLDVRIASKSGDNRKLADAVAGARSVIPPEQLPELLYARLFALNEMREDAAILSAMKDDGAVLQGKPQEGLAMLLYAAVLKRAGKADEAQALLDGFIQRRPDTAEALRARVELANMALAREDYPRAADQLRAVLKAPDAAARLGADTVAECRYNSALAAVRTGDRAGAIQTLEALLKAKPSAELGAAAGLLLGQSYAQAADHGNAVKAWRQALAFGKGVDEADLRDRIGRSLLAAGDAAGARKEYEALAGKLGGADKLPREAHETWARALYATGDFAGAAAAYEALHARFKDSAVYAYECAVCLEKDKKWADAEQWYMRAEKAREDLPAEYAKSLAENLNRVRFQAGTGDMGVGFWLDRLAPGRTEAEFDAAAAALCKIADAGKPDGAVPRKLETAQGAYADDIARHYGIGAVRLHVMAALDDADGLRQLGGKLAGGFAAREKAFTAKSWSTTVAPAMICYYRAEGERRAGNHADALAGFETVLAAYPYNEWPDAAACGAAECYAALGDTQTAVAKLNEVVKAAAGNNPASAKWVERAKKRVAELTGGK